MAQRLGWRRRRQRRPGADAIESRTEKLPYLGLASLTGMVKIRRRVTSTTMKVTEMDMNMEKEKTLVY